MVGRGEQWHATSCPSTVCHSRANAGRDVQSSIAVVASMLPVFANIAVYVARSLHVLGTFSALYLHYQSSAS